MPRFVIHKHQARKLHFDFRLEVNGVLKSWAIPKDIPLERGIKRLAIQTEDHPLSFINFEGTIPEGQYGAGVIEIWDKGDYQLIKAENNEINFILNGEKLKGRYALIKFKDKSWLLFRTR
jgi:bifunctional non-homologous end joining protein LigD